MPRSPIIATQPPGTTPQRPLSVVPSAVWNAAMDDIYSIFNTIQPEAYGGTGAATFAGARSNILGVSVTVDNAVPRFNGTDAALQGSGVLINDSNHLWAVRIGTNAAPTYSVDGYVSGASTATVAARNDTVTAALQSVGTVQANVGTITNHPVVFLSNNTARARFLETGELLFGTTAAIAASSAPVQISRSNGTAQVLERTTATGTVLALYYAGALVGNISVTGGGATFNSTSDYRLPWKAGAVPLANSGEFIDALKPMFFPNASPSGQAGFIAHEFAAVSPSSVNGDKDAMEDGQPAYQTMQAASPDVMANIIAQMQSMRQRLLELETKVAVLETATA